MPCRTTAEMPMKKSSGCNIVTEGLNAMVAAGQFVEVMICLFY
jgi:hypothetical protein